MIIVLRTEHANEVITAVIANYAACYPVTNEHEMVVGAAWLTGIPGAAEVLVVLDTVEPGALEKWHASGRHVLTSQQFPKLTAGLIDDILIVHDKTEKAFSCNNNLRGETPLDMAELCVEAFLG